MDKFIADAISLFNEDGDPIKVSLSNELVHLLSDQLYQSPLKAIEELVVNSYDAGATKCKIYVPSLSNPENRFIMIFDNGIGMDKEGLINLWQIGRSNKRKEELEKRSNRKQIGKFGIGKLATYTIANRLTYITKRDGKILSVTINFDDFSASSSGPTEQIQVPVRITDWDKLIKDSYLSEALKLADAESELTKTDHWTISLLENLKDKSKQIKEGRLRWVLSSAMPLQNDFHLYLNCDEITSSKEDYEKVVYFGIHELPENRLNELQKSTGEKWEVKSDSLISESFKSGVTGNVIVTEKTLQGKSDDLIHSHGFFIKVRNRLVNENDPLFGLKPLYYGIFNRLRVEIQADDLDDGLKASRETIEESKTKDIFRTLLREIFNEANQRYQELPRSDKSEKEGKKQVVAPKLVEYPIADALIMQKSDTSGAEADESWFYLQLEPETDLGELIKNLYTATRSKYKYKYIQSGPTGRLVKFNPKEFTFSLNTDHDLIKEYYEEGRARILLEDFVTAETLLEIYLRINQIPPHIVGDILEQRDALLRSLTKDHIFSSKTISMALRDSTTNEHELEIALVVATRALGFVATHISGAGEPDGIARFIDYPAGEKKITLEAKSSVSIPTLQQIDFAGLEEHVKKHQADGCLLVAPAYPGDSKGEDASVSQRAHQSKISCWTVEQLSRFVEASESRKLNANHLLDIVLRCFSPEEVTKSLNMLLTEPSWDNQVLYKEILRALGQLEERIKDELRSVIMITTEVTHQTEFSSIEANHIRSAIGELASASQGGMTLRDDGSIVIHVSLDELERRLSGLTKDSGEPRKLSNFRET